MRRSIPRRLPSLLVAVAIIASIALMSPLSAPVHSTSVLAPDQSGWEEWTMPDGYSAFIYDLDMVDADYGWAGGIEGFMIHWDGVQWAGVETSFSGLVTAIDMVDRNVGWGSTYRGKAIRYNGSSWEIQADVTGMPLMDIYAVNAGEVWAVGAQGKVFRYSGGGWSEAASVDRWLYGIDMVHPTDGWVVGSQGFTMHYDGGWHGVASGGNDTLYAVDMVTSNDGWAVGADGAIYHYGGSQWAPVTSPTSETLWDVNMLSGDEGWAVGNGGTILYYDGSQWQLAANPDPGNRALQTLYMVDDRDGWALGDFGVALRYSGRPDVSTSSKAVDKRHALTDDRLTYTIRVENTGNQPAPAVVVSDAIPANTTYVAASASPPPDSGPSPLVWTVSDLGAGEHVDLTFEVDITEDLGECWFIINEAVISLGGDDLHRRANTAVGGGCRATNLPLIKRFSD